MYPPVYIIDKQLTEDLQLGNHHLVKGTLVSISMQGIHRNPNVWKNPDEFDPDRWSEERLKAEMQEDTLRFAFIPFSVGARDCIGKLFALYICAWC